MIWQQEALAKEGSGNRRIWQQEDLATGGSGNRRIWQQEDLFTRYTSYRWKPLVRPKNR
jgi:hypothetical protein